MSPSEPLRVGFIGLSSQGWAIKALGPSLVQPSLRDRYTLKAVATSSESSAKIAADKWSNESGNEVKGYGSSTSLLQRADDIDMVAVAVKAFYHKDVVLPFIRAGKDVFIEWPVGASSEETREIASEMKKYGVRSLIGFQARHSPVINKVKAFIDSGKIGKILSTHFIGLVPRESRAYAPETNTEQLYVLDKKKGVTLLNVPGGHTLDLHTYLFGDFASISATGVHHYPTSTIFDSATGEPTGEILPTTGGPDHLSVTGVLKSGALVNMVWRSGVKYSTPGRLSFTWEIDGEEGSIRMQSDQPMGGFIPYNEPELYLNGEKVEVDGSKEGTFGTVTKNWIEYAKGDGVGTHATIDEAVKVKGLLDAIEESMETGRRILISA